MGIHWIIRHQTSLCPWASFRKLNLRRHWVSFSETSSRGVRKYFQNILWQPMVSCKPPPKNNQSRDTEWEHRPRAPGTSLAKNVLALLSREVFSELTTCLPVPCFDNKYIASWSRPIYSDPLQTSRKHFSVGAIKATYSYLCCLAI